MNSLRKIPSLLIQAMVILNLVCIAPGISARSEASVVTTTAHLPISKDLFNPRTNEAVHFADSEAVFRVSFDQSGGTQVEVTCHLRGSGKGLTSGSAYEFMGGGQAKINAGRPPLSEFILTCNGQLSASGTGNPQPIAIVLTLKVNSAGEASAAVRELKAQPQ